jgi:class 3 adenylate cyclase
MNPVTRNIIRCIVRICLINLSSDICAQKRIILEEGNPSILIGESTYVIEDFEDDLSLEQIISPKGDSLFKLYDKPAHNYGNVQLTTWNRFTVVNNSTKDWHMVINSYSLDTLTFYFKDSIGEYQKQVSGRSLPWTKRAYKTGVYVFDLNIPYGDTATFILKVKSYFMQYPMFITTKENFISTYHGRDRVEGFYYGFLLFLLLYNLFLYFSVRDKSYLYYNIYIFLTGIMISQLKGSIAELWGEHLHFLWQYAPAIIAFSSTATFIFTQHILETKKNAPKLHKVLMYFYIPWYVVNIGLSLAGFNLAASISNQIAGISALFVLYATAIVVYRQGFKYARFYIAACWAYFAGVLIFVLQSFMIIPYSVYSNNAIEIGSTIQMIMFAFILADKMNAFKKDKAKAQKNLLESLQENKALITNQNIMLTTKVEERTSELNETLSNLQEAQGELQEKNQLITKEKERSDKLLLNILPEEVAIELKDKGFANAQHFENVTVLFTDFQGFTKMSSALSPQELVAEINEYFSEFDKIVERNNVEKIKTIGDAYMAVGGLPAVNNTHANDVMNAAFEIQEFMNQKAAEKGATNLLYFKCRIGVHSGPVVAGIVGLKKFQYDVWGDTVNTASRFESNGETNRINTSTVTKNLLGNELYDFEYRGKIDAKGKGEMEMYFVNKKI